jgi:hypothetical protein
VNSKDPSSKPAGVLGIPRKNLIIIGVITLAVWAFAISTESLAFLIVVGVLTLALLGLLVWALRLTKKQQRLVSLLEGAATSPEARREALNKLSTDKDANEATHVFARAQLEAADNPAKALETLEALELSSAPPYLQDDIALLRAQLYLHFGRHKDARPMVDRVNVDNPQRKEGRAMMAAIIGETWARTGKANEALTLLDSVDFDKEPSEQLRAQLLIARIFARFASGKKPAAKKDIQTLSELDVNYLGRFLMPQFRVHLELQKMVRSVAERHPQVRRMAKSRTPPRGGRPPR